MILLNNSSKPPTTIDDFTYFCDKLTKIGIGKGMSVSSTFSISETETTKRPVINKGSLVSIGSLIFYATSNEDIIDEASISDGDVHIKVVPSADELTAAVYFTSDSLPEWDTEKAGWYNISGERFLDIVMTKVGTLFIDKGKYTTETGNIIKYFDGSMKVSNNITGVQNIDFSGTISAGTTNPVALKWKVFKGTFPEGVAPIDYPISHDIDITKIVAVAFSFEYIVNIGTEYEAFLSNSVYARVHDGYIRMAYTTTIHSDSSYSGVIFYVE